MSPTYPRGTGAPACGAARQDRRGCCATRMSSTGGCAVQALTGKQPSGRGRATARRAVVWCHATRNSAPQCYLENSHAGGGSTS
eukprot:2170444-Rhodomonas_salina.1